MIDAYVRPLIDPPLNRAGRWLADAGARADAITIAGFVLGLGAAVAVMSGLFGVAAALLLSNRLADGLDGAVARARGKSDRGGFLDITLDFAFYGVFPLAFAIQDPAANALAAAAVLASFYLNGAAFLAFAAMAERRKMHTEAQGEKSLYYVAGLAEGTETIAVFLAWCVLPELFAPIAFAFAALTLLSAMARIVLGAKALS